MKRLPLLQLNLLRQFFDQIALGRKKTEYRDVSDYWTARLANREYRGIRFRNGYAKRGAPIMDVELKTIRIVRDGRKRLYAVDLGKIIRIENWSGPAETK
jgi:hypothetical protein